MVRISFELQTFCYMDCDLRLHRHVLSYIYRSAKFGVKFFNFFVRLFILFSVRKVSYIGKR